jgi:signal transduction histidine kinase
VLVVDDEPDVLTAYRDILLDLGYEVNTALSGLDALEVAKTFCPDILLADNNMPNMSGLQTIEELQRIAPDALSLLTTGYSDIAIVTKALRQSVFDFLLKPVSLENLSHSIQRAVMQLEARERERRQKDFLSIVSHELRAPLQAPLRYLENILTSDEDPLNEKQRNMLQRAAKGIKAEVRLINNLLDLQYIESGRFTIKLRESSVRNTVQDVVESFLLQAADIGVRIFWNPPSDLFLAQLDPEQIRQALANILNNAIQHSPAHGVVRLRLFRCQSKVSIMVRDRGSGMAQPYLERIFEKSFQIPATVGKKGLGVGLYIAREIVRAHGGEIRVKTKLERGSIFVIQLPCANTL